MRDTLTYVLLAAGGLILCLNLYGIFNKLPDEAAQGAIYRIMFFHIPAAITSFIGFFVAMILSIAYLSTKNLLFDSIAASINEVSLIFALINVVTGSIWARIIW